MRTTLFLTVAIDTVFLSFISFISLFLITNYFQSRTVSIAIALTLSLVLSVLFFNILKNKKKNKIYKDKSKKEIEAVLLQLTLKNKTDLCNLFEKALKGEKTDVTRKKGYLYAEKNNTYYFTDFNVDGVTKSTVLKAVNTVKNNGKAIIYCYNIKKEELDFTKKFDNEITFIYGEKVYELLKLHDLLPKIKVTTQTKKPKLNLSAILAKKRAKNYLFFGLLFAFFCFFVRLKIYYIIFSCVFLTLFILSFLFGKKEKVNP